MKLSATMNRTYTLIVLLGLVVGALLTGCSPSDQNPAPAKDTNAAPAAAASTNK